MRKLATILLVLSVLIPTGCWDMREINELGMVMAVGVDNLSNSQTYTVTVQIANLNPTDSSKSQSGSRAESMWIVSGEGKSIFEAIRQISKVSSKKIMWAHNNIIIIGESCARNGIIPVLDFFTHSPETRLKTPVVVAKGDASDYISTSAVDEDISGISLSEIFRFSTLTAESLQTDMLRLAADMYSSDSQPILSSIDFKNKILPNSGQPQKIINLSGSAVFDKDKLLGFLSPEETRGVALVLNSFNNTTNNTVITVIDPEHDNKAVSVETKNVKTKLVVNISEHLPDISIQISGIGKIVEEGASTNLSIQAMKTHLEELIDNKIADDINLALDKVQKDYQSDVLGFGKLIHAQHKEAWQTDINDKWSTIYPEMPVTIAVDIRITNSSVKTKPMDAQKGEIIDASQNQ